MSAPHEPTAFTDLGKVLVIIPTYNESDNIEGIVGRLRGACPDVDVLVADDNSPDGTGDIADALAENDPHVQVLHRKGKEGLGAAYLAGFHWGIDRGYDILVEMDADGSHQPEQLPRLLEAVRDADLVLGSRWVPGGAIVNWPSSRKFISRGGSFYSRTMLGLDIRDVTGGFRAFRKETLIGIDMDSVASQGYCFQVDLAWRAVRRGYRVVEVPITFVERERGNSKMSRTILAEALWRVTAWGAGRQMDRFRRGDKTDKTEARKDDGGLVDQPAEPVHEPVHKPVARTEDKPEDNAGDKPEDRPEVTAERGTAPETGQQADADAGATAPGTGGNTPGV